MSVIQGGDIGLAKSVALIPAQYHCLALRACFPSITREHALCLQQSHLSTTSTGNVLRAVFKALTTFTSLQKLSLCTHVHAKVSAEAFSNFEVAVSQLRHLQVVHLEGGIVTRAAVESLAEAIPHCTLLSSVTIHRVGVSQEPGSARVLALKDARIFKSMRACPRLQAISIRYVSFPKGIEGEKPSRSALADIATLTFLTLTNQAISVQDLQQFAYHLVTAIDSFPNLHLLNISGNGVKDIGTRHIVDIVKKMPDLQVLNLAWNDISSVGAASLASVLSTLSALTCIDFEGNTIGSGLEPLADAWQNLPTVQHLNLNSCGSLDGRILGSSLSNLSRLTFLDLRMCNLEADPDSVDGIFAFTMCLQHLRSLRELRMGVEDCMFDEALEIILPRIALQTDLTTLQIKSEVNFVVIHDEGEVQGSENGEEERFQDAAHEAELAEIDESDEDTDADFTEDNDDHMPRTTSLAMVSHHLKSLSKLQTLALDSSLQLSTRDAETLFDALSVIPTLRHLSLQFTPSADSAEVLANSVSKLTTLHSLDISGCGISEETAGELGFSLASLTSLQMLCLRRNKLRDSGAIVLAAHLQHVCSLKEVDLSRTRISNVGAGALIEAFDEQGSLSICWLQDNRILRRNLPKRQRQFSIILGPSS